MARGAIPAEAFALCQTCPDELAVDRTAERWGQGGPQRRQAEGRGIRRSDQTQAKDSKPWATEPPVHITIGGALPREHLEAAHATTMTCAPNGTAKLDPCGAARRRTAWSPAGHEPGYKRADPRRSTPSAPSTDCRSAAGRAAASAPSSPKSSCSRARPDARLHGKRGRVRPFPPVDQQFHAAARAQTRDGPRRAIILGLRGDRRCER